MYWESTFSGERGGLGIGSTPKVLVKEKGKAVEVKNPTEMRRLTKKKQKKIWIIQTPSTCPKMALLIKGTTVLYNNGGG